MAWFPVLELHPYQTHRSSGTGDPKPLVLLDPGFEGFLTCHPVQTGFPWGANRVPRCLIYIVCVCMKLMRKSVSVYIHAYIYICILVCVCVCVFVFPTYSRFGSIERSAKPGAASSPAAGISTYPPLPFKGQHASSSNLPPGGRLRRRTITSFARPKVQFIGTQFSNLYTASSNKHVSREGLSVKLLPARSC